MPRLPPLLLAMEWALRRGCGGVVAAAFIETSPSGKLRQMESAAAEVKLEEEKLKQLLSPTLPGEATATEPPEAAADAEAVG